MPRIKFGYASMKFMHNEDGSYLLEMLKSEKIEVVKKGIEAFEEFVKRASRLTESVGEAAQLVYHDGEEV